ncbi:hypothetical protein B0H11DRAFT_1908236 [Mycena galericulata]|nr:hypothetical protein B0H11DRAFT_1908236 [Mycena galericulata]
MYRVTPMLSESIFISHPANEVYQGCSRALWILRLFEGASEPISALRFRELGPSSSKFRGGDAGPNPWLLVHVGTDSEKAAEGEAGRATMKRKVRIYGGPDAHLFPPRKLLTPPRKFAFFGVPARDFGSSITSRSRQHVLRGRHVPPRAILAPRARKTELRHARAQIGPQQN